jgi:PhnO protein
VLGFININQNFIIEIPEKLQTFELLILNFMIREAHKEDIDMIFEFICKLENSQFDNHAFRLIFDKNIVNPDCHYFVAIQNGLTIGFISCHTHDLLHHCGKVGEIQELYIDPAYRNQGFGRLLINEIIKIAKIEHFTSLEVSSNKKRTENVSIYEHFGFRLTHNTFTMEI